MIEVKNLDFAYQKEKVLDNINLNVQKGESLAVIGPSGCGKTTLLYLLAGLETADRGVIKINSELLSGLGIEVVLFCRIMVFSPGKLFIITLLWDLKSGGLLLRKSKKKLIQFWRGSRFWSLKINIHPN